MNRFKVNTYHYLVNEEGGDGEGADSEASPLLSYRLRYTAVTSVSRRLIDLLFIMNQ